MLDSKHFWMYIQLNSAPRAPTHSVRPRERITSAVAHPKPAVINLLWPLPGIRDKTTANPNKSAISMVHRKNSYKLIKKNSKQNTRLAFQVDLIERRRREEKNMNYSH